MNERTRNKSQNHYEYFSTNSASAEYFIQSILAFIVREDDHVIDVGANRGFYTEYLAKLVGEKGRVYAFEPIPSLADELRIKFNTVDYSHVKIINKALTKPGNTKKTSFHYVKGNDYYSGIKRRGDIQDNWDIETITIPIATLDQSIDKNEKISCIKVDAEWGDFDILKGAKRILTESKPLVIFEFGGDSAAELYNYSNEEFFQFFEKIKYNLYRFTGDRFTGYDERQIYWELWAVPKNSQYEYYFKRNISYFADIWIKDK